MLLPTLNVGIPSPLIILMSACLMISPGLVTRAMFLLSSVFRLLFIPQRASDTSMSSLDNTFRYKMQIKTDLSIKMKLIWFWLKMQFVCFTSVSSLCRVSGMWNAPSPLAVSRYLRAPCLAPDLPDQDSVSNQNRDHTSLNYNGDCV